MMFGPNDADVAKTLVMAELARIVAEGSATVVRFKCGTVELRFATGEIFRLGEDAITRVA